MIPAVRAYREVEESTVHRRSSPGGTPVKKMTEKEQLLTTTTKTSPLRPEPAAAAHAERPVFTFRQRLIACIQYGAVSTSITLFNRAVFSVYHFNFPSFVTLIQILVSLVYMYLLKWSGHMELGGLSLETSKKVAPLALFWWLYVVSGVTALRHLNVPMFSVIRRSTTLLVVLGEVLMFNKKPTRRAFVALLVMVAGAVLAGATDLTYSLPGYIWVSVCVVSTAVYLLLIKKLKDVTGLGQNTLLLYNSVLALPLMTAHLFLATDEMEGVKAYPDLWDPSFQAFLLFSCSLAFVLNICIFRCTLVNSPLATNVTGQMKDILTTALGMVIFSDVKYSPWNVGGIVLGLLGSITYSTVSYIESKRAASGHIK